MSETIYRCAECGKWSHAKRRPPHHRRFIPDTEERLGCELTKLPVIEEVEPFEEDVPFGDPHTEPNLGGVWVKCGPFETWTATREAA